MTEQFLHVAERAARREQHRGGAVPQVVDADVRELGTVEAALKRLADRLRS